MAIRAKLKRAVSTAATAVSRSTAKPKPRPAARKAAASAPARKVVSKVVVSAQAPAPRAVTTNFTRATRFLSSLSDFERSRIVRYNTDQFNLDRMRVLLKKMGNPQQAYKSVHIAGTKGKGSTCAMLTAMLRAVGLKVGLYTSPHLIDIRERIQVNGEMISEIDFGRLVLAVEPLVAKMKDKPTYFDVLTAVAFKYFADQQVDIAIIETGMGGRLDSTNVIEPEVTAITSISKDHMAQLGGTLRKIATEKAGIFKPGVPALTVEQDPEVEAVFRAEADRVGTTLDICGKTIEFSCRFESSRLTGPHNRICLTTANSKFEHLAVPLMGEHQAINCGLALSIVDRLKTRGVSINDSKIMEGLASTTIPGRMEMVSTMPRVLLDGAHNAASIDALMKAIGQHILYDSMVVIFGCCSDKDVPGMLDRVTAGADKVIFCPVPSIRSANPAELAAKYIDQYGKMAQVAQTLEEALAIAARAVTKEDLICITGSFYLIGEAKKFFAAKAATKAAEAKAAAAAQG